MLRIIFFTLIGLLIVAKVIGQKNVGQDAILKDLSEKYNQEQYHELYLMLSPEFKAQFPENELTSFYRDRIRKNMGKIQSWSNNGTKGKAWLYAVQFDNGLLDLQMVLNSANEIDGIQWLPHQKTASAVKKDPQSISSSNPKLTKTQKIIDSIVMVYIQNPANAGLVVGIIKNGSVEQYYYGTTNKTKATLPSDKTLFEIGSITKTFTGLILAHAIQEGKLQANDDIRKYLPGEYPDLQYNGHPITVAQLSCHTSELPRIPADLFTQPGYDGKDPYKHYTRSMLLNYLKTVRPDTMPGTVNSYSNLGAAVLGIVLEQAYNSTIQALTDRFITHPLQMDQTSFDAGTNQMPTLARGYTADGIATSYWNLGIFAPAGGIKSNINDMLKYLKTNMQETDPAIKLTHQPLYNDKTMAVGMNWMISTTTDKQTLIWHNGGTGGFRSFIGWLKDEGVGIVILSNAANDLDATAILLLKELEK